MKKILKSKKLEGVCYDIRGPVLTEAKHLEEEGHQIIKLNIGNPAPFGFEAPEEIIHDVILNLPNASGYTDSKGLFAARKAIMQEFQSKNIYGIDIEDIFLGNGVSELIVMATQALINDGDEVLIPSPDYPLWTAAVNLAGGKAVHYLTDCDNEWQPDIDDIKSKINKKTKAIVVINPNNPTGAVYSKETLQAIVDLAEQHQLVVCADEIYDKIIYDDVKHFPLASLVNETLCLSFNGLSKSYRSAGLRSGWLVISGNKSTAKDYISGLEILATMRLCSNAPAQYAIQTALGGYQSINELTRVGGRLYKQRDLAWQLLNDIPGVSCIKAKGALYLFPKLDPDYYAIENDEKLILDILKQQRVLLVNGTAFNWVNHHHFRIIFLPNEDDLREAIARIANFLAKLRQ